MRLYKFYSARWGREAIKKRRLKLTKVEDINDPFEFMAVSWKDKENRATFRDWKKDFPAKIGLISFCSAWHNPLLWSHYADSHSGLCLGFDVPDENCVQVEYVKERIEFLGTEQDRSLPPPERIGMRLLKTKFEHWKYESEYRVFTFLSDSEVIEEAPANAGRKLFFLSFNPLFNLKEVILGPLYQSSNCGEAAVSLRALSVKSIKTTRPAFTDFRIVTQENPRLQKTI